MIVFDYVRKGIKMVHFGRVSTAMVTPFDKKGHVDFLKRPN